MVQAGPRFRQEGSNGRMQSVQTRQKAIILGAGIMGLCAAHGMHARGWEVHVIDQAAPPNPRGASVDHHRLIRHAYGTQHGYMRMVDDAFAAWRRIFSDIGEAPYVETGVLALGEAAGPGWLADSRAAMRGHGIAVQDLAADTIPASFPYFSATGIADAFFAAPGGVLLAGRIVQAMARWLAGQGVVFETARVVSVDGRALRLTDGATRAGDALVVAAGPWAPRLLPGLAGRVRASRQIILRLAPPPDLAAAWETAPMLLDLAAGAGFYLVPPVAGTPIKLGDHSFSLAGDAEADPRDATAAEAAAILDLARHRIPRLDEYEILGAAACYYDVEPREEFVVERIAPQALVMSGFSGHGFKFASVLGHAAANALTDPSLMAALPDWAAGRAAPAPGLLTPESMPA